MRVQPEDDMLQEYDFTSAVQNPYAQRFKKSGVIALDPDVSAVFPDSEAVNRALRSLIEVAKANVR